MLFRIVGLLLHSVTWGGVRSTAVGNTRVDTIWECIVVMKIIEQLVMQRGVIFFDIILFSSIVYAVIIFNYEFVMTNIDNNTNKERVWWTTCWRMKDVVFRNSSVEKLEYNDVSDLESRVEMARNMNLSKGRSSSWYIDPM